MAENDDEARLKALANKVHEAKREAGLLPQPNPEEAGSGQGMQAGVNLVASVLVCTGLGIALDKWLNMAPLFLLVFLVLGFAAGMWGAYRASQGVSEFQVGFKSKSTKREEEK